MVNFGLAPRLRPSSGELPAQLTQVGREGIEDGDDRALLGEQSGDEADVGDRRVALVRGRGALELPLEGLIHVSSTGLGQHWKERTESVTSRRAAGDEIEEEEALSAATFALPGNRGYAGGRAWKFGRQETPPSAYDSESEFYSSDGDESNFLSTRLNREKKRKVSV